MSTRIDFHSHIIPGADHGCATSKEAAEQLIMMKNAGIGTVVATPHFYPEQHRIDDFMSRVDVGVASLQQAYAEEAPRILLGAEVLLRRSGRRG